MRAAAFCVYAFAISSCLHMLLWGIYGLCTGMPFFSTIASVDFVQGLFYVWTFYIALVMWRKPTLLLTILLGLAIFGVQWVWFDLRANLGRPGYSIAVQWYGVKPLLFGMFFAGPGALLREVGTHLGWTLPGEAQPKPIWQ